MLADLKKYLHIAHGIVLDDEVLTHILWADDLVLLSSTAEGLQQQLNGLFTFCQKYQMIVNEMKTKVMIFGKPVTYVFKFNNTILDIVQDYKYLGVVLSSIKNCRGNIYKKMVDYTVDRSNRANFMLYRKTKSIGHLPCQIGSYMFNTHVLPILNYSCELWCTTKENSRIESVQMKYHKFILGVKHNTCSAGVRGELGLFMCM